ncbi:PspC domain-containing protein [Kineococcus sp. SYSU DK004]|uniref:PspC domain-containing protein n=1 Tax=Kineococcus sp. SYSU DK004 TaxID=3383125 RepID=UPI003D7E753B
MTTNEFPSPSDQYPGSTSQTSQQVPPVTEEPAVTAGPARSGADRFFDRVRGLGVVRGGDRWVGGVAGGLAQRLSVPSWTVRAAFVVLALLGGAGLTLYGLAWALLPDSTGRIEAQAAQRGDVSVALVVAGLLVVGDLLFGVNPWSVGWVF